eukprot:CAMPEP_0174835500 /NCGR_PEP_ID=MMETSP1114-20130205/5436_1 /TAXON_ID=312471 /ORGANISM="Neobodo designis, Strain CCAP 1951/1" /LENGTH=417 /DNA_ID=CAMNT_0016069449 /DNA_START=35 /DNA_END=1288 /DNA_ORIENTATION=+
MRPTFTSASPEDCKEIECAVCLEPWDGPVELAPCGHVFCAACAQPLQRCPDCRQQIRARKDPNRILCNLANAAQMRCEACQWVGSREASRGHRCAPTPSRSPQPPPPGPSAYHQPPPPQQQQRHWQAPPPQAASADAPWRRFGLGQDEYDHIFAVFMTFDTDGSGELDRAELKTLCRWLNYAHSDADVDAMFRAMDTDGSGALSMDEFCGWISTHRPDPQALYGLDPVSYNQVLFQFHTYDRDQNGALDEDEFVGLALRQGYSSDANAARALFRAVDTDRSGTIDLHELLTFTRAQREGANRSNAHHHHHQHQHQQPPAGWHQEYPAPAPHGERPRYAGAHPAPQAQWQYAGANAPPPQGGWHQPPPATPPQSYPPSSYGAPPPQGRYDPSQPYPSAQPVPHHHDNDRRKKGDCIVA